MLERYAREGHLHPIREESEEYRQSEWVTRMACLATTDFGADWIVNSDADEFWWPHGSNLTETLLAVPPRYGAIEAIVRNFVPRPDDDRSFAERMTVRLVGVAPVNAPTASSDPWERSCTVGLRGSPSAAAAILSWTKSFGCSGAGSPSRSYTSPFVRLLST